MNVIILRGGVEEDDDEHNGGVDDEDDDVIDVSTALAMFELESRGDSEDADGRDEESIAVDEAAEGLREGEEEGDKRKLRMGRDSTGLDGECSRS